MNKQPPHNASIQALHEDLGIPASYAESCQLAFCEDCADLVETETDVFGRQPLMARPAFAAWQAMQASAEQDGIVLQIVSAFRSAEYQKDLLQRKLERGDTLEAILRVNAAPGYSEHHSGCAVDITTPGYTPLEEEFEDSDAFRWLCEHAANFGFTLSFPRDNAAGMSYEPWHWKFDEKTIKG